MQQFLENEWLEGSEDLVVVEAEASENPEESQEGVHRDVEVLEIPGQRETVEYLEYLSHVSQVVFD